MSKKKQPGRAGGKVRDYRRQAFEGFMQMVQQEIDEGDPPETRMTYNRLRAEGYSELDTIVMLALAAMYTYHEIIIEETPFNLARYVEYQLRLPELPNGKVYTPITPDSPDNGEQT